MGILNPQGGRPVEPAGPRLTSIDAVAAVCLSERAHVPQVDLQFYVAEDDNHTHFGFLFYFLWLFCFWPRIWNFYLPGTVLSNPCRVVRFLVLLVVFVFVCFFLCVTLFHLVLVFPSL